MPIFLPTIRFDSVRVPARAVRARDRTTGAIRSFRVAQNQKKRSVTAAYAHRRDASLYGDVSGSNGDDSRHASHRHSPCSGVPRSGEYYKNATLFVSLSRIGEANEIRRTLANSCRQTSNARRNRVPSEVKCIEKKVTFIEGSFNYF